MVQRSGGLVEPAFKPELGVNVALVLVLSACTFEIGDEKCCKNLANVVLLMFLLSEVTQESFYLQKKKEFLFIIYSRFNQTFHPEAGLLHLCVSPSWPSTLEK